MVDELIYILPDHVGGVASVVYNLLKYSRSAFKRKVILLRTSSQNQDYIEFKFDCDEQIVLLIDKNQSLVSIYKAICSHISNTSIIISNEGWYEIDALTYCRKNNPVIYILHGNFKHYYYQIYKHRDKISKVIAVSSYLKNEAQSYYDGDIEFIKFPIDNSGNLDTSKYFAENIVINYAGRLEEAKGTQYFPSITEKLDEAGIPYELNIFGNGEHDKMLSEKYEHQPNVRLYGQQPKERVLLSHKEGQLLFLFSKTEGLPVCVVEAMKCGVVPIVFEIPSGIPDIISNGVNGFILPQGDVAGVVNIVKRMYSDRLRLKQVALAAYTSSTKEFDPFIQVQKYENGYLSSKGKKQSFNLLKRICLRLPAPKYYILESYFKKFQSIINF
jgi:glycosyltransferase involved in cell wall biosynthesis